MKARVLVTLRTGVLDPQGQAVAEALRRLGFPEVNDVRVGKLLEIELQDGARAEIEPRLAKMCDELLRNPVIEDARIEWPQ